MKRWYESKTIWLGVHIHYPSQVKSLTNPVTLPGPGGFLRFGRHLVAQGPHPC